MVSILSFRCRCAPGLSASPVGLCGDDIGRLFHSQRDRDAEAVCLLDDRPKTRLQPCSLQCVHATDRSSARCEQLNRKTCVHMVGDFTSISFEELHNPLQLVGLNPTRDAVNIILDECKTSLPCHLKDLVTVSALSRRGWRDLRLVRTGHRSSNGFCRLDLRGSTLGESHVPQSSLVLVGSGRKIRAGSAAWRGCTCVSTQPTPLASRKHLLAAQPRHAARCGPSIWIAATRRCCCGGRSKCSIAMGAAASRMMSSKR
jgi:hypothetical protein